MLWVLGFFFSRGIAARYGFGIPFFPRICCVILVFSFIFPKDLLCGMGLDSFSKGLLCGLGFLFFFFSQRFTVLYGLRDFFPRVCCVVWVFSSFFQGFAARFGFRFLFSKGFLCCLGFRILFPKDLLRGSDFFVVVFTFQRVCSALPGTD